MAEEAAQPAAEPEVPAAPPAEAEPRKTDKGGNGAAPADDWRASLKSDDARKFAESSPDVDHLVSRALTFQKQLSAAIVKPGKDAKPEEVSAYRKRVGIPETPEGYKFKPAEGVEPTESDKAFQAALAKAYHGLDITADQAKGLNEVWNKTVGAMLEAQKEADAKFAEEAEAELRKAWSGKEWDTNHAHADRAVAWMFGDQAEEIRHMETKDGRFVADHPVFVRAMAAVGREMAEGGLVPPLSDDAAAQIDEEIVAVRKKADEAKVSGNSKEANRLYQAEQRLIAKKLGNRPIVGAAGRGA